MKVSTEQRPPREAVLTVKLDESDVEPHLERAYRQAVRRLNIPGFRKGKAPRRILEQLYGRDYLINEALDSMVNEATTKAVEDEGLELGGIPSITIEELDPPSFTATVPLTPTVDLGGYRSVRVPKDEVKVGKQQIDDLIEQLRRDAAVWEPVDGPLAEDDLASLSVVGWVEDGGERKEIVRSESVDYVPHVGGRFPVPDFDEALIGLPQGEQRTFTIDVPKDFENEELAGKKALFEATVHSVKRKELPSLDDEFAKGIGDGYDSMKALRSHVEADLLARDHRNADAKHQEETLLKVTEAATIEISDIIVEHEIAHYLEDQEQDIRSGRFTVESYQQYLAWQTMEPEAVRADAKPKVAERLKRAHVLREVARQEAFEATDAEVDAEVESIVESSSTQADEVRKLFTEQERRESLRRVLVNRKAIEHLTSIALQVGGRAGPKAKRAPAKRPAAKGTAAKGPAAQKSKAKTPAKRGEDEGGTI